MRSYSQGGMIMANRKTTNAANQKKNSDPLAKYPLEIQEYLRLPEGTKKDYDQFVLDFTTFAGENQKLISRTLSNIFTMREIGNKTHGDLAEIAINEFINQYMASMGYRSIHVGKAFYRNKEHEEDIGIIKDKKTRIPVSLKAYGNGPLQLSTDKDSRLFTLLKTIHSTQSPNSAITNRDEIEKIFSTPAFSEITALNIMPLIYKEKDKKCNIMIFDVEKAKKETARIEYVPPTDASVKQRGKKGNNRSFSFSIRMDITSVKFAMANRMQMHFSADSGQIQIRPNPISQV